MDLTEEQKQHIIETLKGNWNDYKHSMDEATEELDNMRTNIQELPKLTENVNEEFCEKTSLNKKDSYFVIFASALQVARQALLNYFKERLNDKEAANKTIGHNKEEHSSRRTTRYYASIDEIINNPVPFDCIRKEEIVQKYDNPHLSGFNHRFKAVGHDPFLGLIVGTANIMTNTLTMTEGRFLYKTYHVHTGIGYRGTTPYEIDKMCARANTKLMFKKIYERLKKEGTEGYKALAIALCKEVVHLLSDFRTKQSLPLPIISSINTNASRLIGFGGLDYLVVKSVEREAYMSEIINFIIQTLHRMCYNEEVDGPKELYNVRTIKIINYSNEIATASSLIQTIVRLELGDVKAIKNYDLGGSIITLHHSLKDGLTIRKIQQEYLLSQQINYIKNI